MQDFPVIAAGGDPAVFRFSRIVVRVPLGHDELRSIAQAACRRSPSVPE
jgi:hypothetical protein